MALAAYAIVTVAEARTQLKIATAETGEDTKLETFIDQVSAWVEDYCGRNIVVQSHSNEVHDGDGTPYLFPLHFPVTQLSTATTPTDANKLAAVQYRVDVDSTWTDIETSVNHIFLDSRKPYVELYDTVFPLGRQNVRISYKSGFTGVDLDPVKRVVLEMVQIAWGHHRGGNDTLGKDSRGEGGATGAFSTSYRDMKPEWKDVLDRYRVRRV